MKKTARGVGRGLRSCDRLTGRAHADVRPGEVPEPSESADEAPEPKDGPVALAVSQGEPVVQAVTQDEPPELQDEPVVLALDEIPSEDATALPGVLQAG